MSQHHTEKTFILFYAKPLDPDSSDMKKIELTHSELMQVLRGKKEVCPEVTWKFEDHKQLRAWANGKISTGSSFIDEKLEIGAVCIMRRKEDVSYS